MTTQPCVCIARCNHCICDAVAPADASLPAVSDLLSDPAVRERFEQTSEQLMRAHRLRIIAAKLSGDNDDH